MPALAIVLLSIAAAVVYGILHDQITARICVEYFTIGHPPIFNTEDPTLLGLGWGIIATWWVGLLLGVPLAASARAGSRPPRSVGSLLRPMAILLGVMGCCALLAALAGWALASSGAIFLVGPMARAVPAGKHVAFLTAAFAHSASYASGFFGGLFVVWQVWRSRSVLGTTPQP